jgi:hypothetical protein
MISLIGLLTRRTGSGGRKAPRAFRYAVLEHASGRRTFVKTYPKHVKFEFLRGRAIRETAARTKIFRAPQPLELIESENIIIWEHLDSLSELREFLMEHVRRHPGLGMERTRLIFESGRALAALHDGLLEVGTHGESSPIGRVSTGDDELDRHIAGQLASCPRRPLHWDFCCGNLFVTQEKAGTPAELVILDAMPNHYVLQKDGPDVLCPIYVDIGQMIFSLYCHPLFSRAISGETDIYANQFLDGYSKQAGIKMDRATAFGCAAEINRLYRTFREKRTGRLSFSERLDRQFWAKSSDRLMELARCGLRHEGETFSAMPASPVTALHT